MLVKYKEQQAAERGFWFLKNPLFFTDSMFLKSSERIEALPLIMGLWLFIGCISLLQIHQVES
jgi:transposase